jgi:hypothetical protein
MSNFSNNPACRGGVLSRAKIMGCLTWHYPNSKANLYYNNKFDNNTVRERDVSRFDYQRYNKRLKAPLRAEFQEFRQRQCNRRYTSCGRHWNACRWVPFGIIGMPRMTIGSKGNWKPVQYPYVDRFLDDNGSHIRHVWNQGRNYQS